MRNSFEDLSLASIDIDRLHEKALKVMSQGRVEETSFVEPYGEETVSTDLERVKKLKSQFAAKETPQGAELKKIADIFEALILFHGEQSNWLGENAVTIKTSEYDDFVNGVDAVIEFQGSEPGTASYLGLAADVTFTADTTDKFDRLRSQIDRGELAKVKYFHSEHMNVHGQLSKLPEVILGASKGTVLEVAELWAEREMLALAEHRIQIMLLQQAREQLKTFAMYADSLGDDHKDIASIYRERLMVIEGILAEKQTLVNKVQYEIQDSVHESIMYFMSRWQKELMAKKDNPIQ